MNRADRALRRIRNWRAEWKLTKGKEPETIRVNQGDMIALVDAGYVKDDVLSGTEIKVLCG